MCILAFSLDTRRRHSDVRRVARSLRFPVGLMCDSSAPGYGHIWRLPVSFTIDRAGRLAEDGELKKKPAWTSERLDQVVAPLLVAWSHERPLRSGANSFVQLHCGPGIIDSARWRSGELTRNLPDP